MAESTRRNLPPSHVLLLIHHSHGDIEIPLERWMREGPGPRYLTQPASARDRVTGKPVSLRKIPLAYRNNALSAFLIELGVLADPWSGRRKCDPLGALHAWAERPGHLDRWIWPLRRRLLRMRRRRQVL
jgi:hypothetical protein